MPFRLCQGQLSRPQFEVFHRLRGSTYMKPSSGTDAKDPALRTLPVAFPALLWKMPASSPLIRCADWGSHSWCLLCRTDPANESCVMPSRRTQQRRRSCMTIFRSLGTAMAATAATAAQVKACCKTPLPCSTMPHQGISGLCRAPAGKTSM